MKSLYTQCIAGLLFPLQEAFKGHGTRGLRRQLERSQWWSPAQLETLQAVRLSDLLRRVAVTIPYYRDHHDHLLAVAADVEPLQRLSELPIIDKALLRDQGEVWRNEDDRRLIRQTTSGSSGEPLSFWLSPERVGMDVAAKWRATRWWGLDVGDREVVVWGSGIETGGQTRLRVARDALFRSRLLPAHGLSDPKMDDMLAQIRRFRPRMLFGYPSVLARLAWRARDTGMDIRSTGVKVSFTTAEVLRPEWRHVIGDTFGCDVANEYGARDAGFIARECPHGSLHVTAEALIVEVLDDDDRPVHPGETGNLVVTNLFSAGYPFIRYRTGDRARLSTGACACGRGLPVLEAVEGRSNDGLIAADGGWVHGSAINYTMRGFPELRSYKVVQQRRDLIEVFVVCTGAIPPAMRRDVVQRIRHCLGGGVEVKIIAVERIPPEANGKFRHVVCRITDDARADSTGAGSAPVGEVTHG